MRNFGVFSLSAVDLFASAMGAFIIITIILMPDYQKEVRSQGDLEFLEELAGKTQALLKETEQGTMEMLIATPVRPLEVMLGKILPYVFVGYVQTLVFLAASFALFDIPFTGEKLAFFIGFNIFILVNLALGFLISTLARSQMQAMQLSFFTILPSILLSGFMFPFAGMPVWAQFLGTGVPATHFLRLIRKVMLKGAGVGDVTSEYTALVIILLVVGAIAAKRYRQTLD